MTTEPRSPGAAAAPDAPGPPDAAAPCDRPSWRRGLLAVTAALVPGLGHLLLGRRRAGAALLGGFLAAVAAGAVAAARLDRVQVLRGLVSPDALAAVTALCVLVAVAWVASIVHVHVLTRPRRFGIARRAVGAGLAVALCATVVVPLGLAATLAHSQRDLLDAVFPTGPAAAAAAPAPAAPLPEPRLNVLLLGTDDGPDRVGARTDTVIVASVHTDTAETVLFALPRNLQGVAFPPGSPAHGRFPDGFDGLLNAVYPFGVAHPETAPAGPTADPGVNLLMSAIEQTLALPLHHYIRIDMAGLAAIVDALGGVTVDVGPEPLPIGGVTPGGRLIEPEGYVEPGVQHLDGREALWFARARRNSSDYDRMERQRCLIAAVLAQNGPGELLLRFRAVAAAATDHIATSIPRAMLPALVSLVSDNGGVRLRAVSFDPDLPDPTAPGGTFRPADPDLDHMRRVVDAALSGPAPSGGGGTAAARSPPPAAAPPAVPARTCAGPDPS